MTQGNYFKLYDVKRLTLKHGRIHNLKNVAEIMGRRDVG